MVHAERTVLFPSSAERHFVSAGVEWRIGHRQLDVKASRSVVVVGLFLSMSKRSGIWVFERQVKIDEGFFWE